MKEKYIPSTFFHENLEGLVKQLLELIENQSSISQQKAEQLKTSKKIKKEKKNGY